MQNKINISREECTDSPFFMTSEILSKRIDNLSKYWSFDPEKIMKQTLLKDLILFLFSVCSFEKKEEERVTLSKYSANKSLYLSRVITWSIILPQ